MIIYSRTYTGPAIQVSAYGRTPSERDLHFEEGVTGRDPALYSMALDGSVLTEIDVPDQDVENVPTVVVQWPSDQTAEPVLENKQDYGGMGFNPYAATWTFADPDKVLCSFFLRPGR